MQESARRAVTAPWIIGPGSDLLLIIATPLLILPLTYLAMRGFEEIDVRYFILAFGSMGHNLPGMLRAYGDRALFRRFRMRLILAPLVFGGVCFYFASQGSNLIILLAYLWSVWHAWMQVYGFVRIYDAKGGSFGPVAARLDFGLCATWFVAAVVFSDARLQFVQTTALNFGFGVLGPAGIGSLRDGFGVLLVVVTGLHLGYQIRELRAGRPINLLKNLLLFSSIGLWWFANVFIDNVLIGLVMFEAAHDVQYLAIVWVFNRARVEKQAGAGAFTAFLFRRSWGLMGIYVAMVFAYGSTLWFGRDLAATPGIEVALYTFVTTSALLHYYLDGFIWKIREADTKAVLGVGGAGGVAARPLVTAHGLKCIVLAVPVLLLAAVEDPQRQYEPSVTRTLYEGSPEQPGPRFAHGRALYTKGQRDAGLAHMEAALRAEPGNGEWRRDFVRAATNLALERCTNQDIRAAESLVRRVKPWEPALATRLWRQAEQRPMGMTREVQVQTQGFYLLVLLAEPGHEEAHLRLARGYFLLGNRSLAEGHLAKFASLHPGDPRIVALRQRFDVPGK